MKTRILIATAALASLMLAACGPGLPTGIDTEALVAYWDLDDGKGTIVSDATGEYDGSIVGDPTWIDEGKVDGALEFDGVDDSVNVGALIDEQTQALTIAAWIRPDPDEDGRILAASSGTATNDHAYSLQWEGTFARVRLTVVDADDESTTEQFDTDALTIAEDGWVHLAFVFDGSIVDDEADNLVIYVDGAEAASDRIDGVAVAASELDAFIANVNATDDRFFAGAIDEVVVFARALTAAEILELQ